MNDDYSLKRDRMVKDQLIPRGIQDPRVLQAMGKVPRHLFIDQGQHYSAYGDHPLPIGHGQTISQPYIVALMTEILKLTGTEKTLEIGSGSGYQTAVLAELSSVVYTVERISPLLDQAKSVLNGLGYTNIHYKAFDGTLGWAEHAPYDAIMVTAAGPFIPEPLTNQLADGGRLVIPTGNRIHQELIRVEKRGTDLIRTRHGGCRFVDLIGVHGWKD